MNMENEATPRVMSDQVFADLGGGKVAYLRSFDSAELRSLFPEAPAVQPGILIWALVNADGRAIMLTDSRDAAIANAREHDLEMASVH